MPGIRLGSHIPRTVLDVQRRICGGLPLQLAHKPVAASLTGKSCSRGLLPLVWPREIILNFPLLLYQSMNLMNLGVWRFRLFAFTVYLAPVDLHRSAGGFRRQVFVGLGKRHVVNSYRGTEMSGGFVTYLPYK